MIYKKGSEVVAKYLGSKPIAAVYRGSKLVWEAANSCFAAGTWYDDKSWSNTEGWGK